jgi:hypothetical protein
MMKIVFLILVFVGLLATACKEMNEKPDSIELITTEGRQDSIFRNLISITGNEIPEQELTDSLAFMVLPVQASCPSCRGKSIDSIMKYQDKLAANHYIIISAKGGRKTINSYFKEEDATIPVTMQGILFLDSLNKAKEYRLYDEQPTMYYSYNKKVFKKVVAVPSTVREDLREFFSGYR